MFFGKMPRTVQRPTGGVPQAPKNMKKKALRKTALLKVKFHRDKYMVKKKVSVFKTPSFNCEIFDELLLK